ncbi:SDR family NAD(P)-dependent oxidoreductase [Solimonas marina]|uniref:SDR family oxidoreductase n=1 Tax=Solimonas marina TaxID=2714601 RepID=A0A969WAV8_9GAMM|nr:SDR family oxidoreductase [Solimonas marina]NKF22111.1 SDR family oxidoreductase [Solimonas marina]
MKDFRDKIVVVTGAGSGMGRAYAVEFARLGARLALNDFDAPALAETVRLLGIDEGERLHSAAFDVGDRAAMERFAGDVRTRLGHAHVVINNAGIEGVGKPVWATPAEAYTRVLHVNFHGVLNGTQAFLPQLIENGEGAIVNVSSIFGLIGPPNHADYSASKFAVRGFTEALMVELRGTRIGVHLVHPGGIATNIARQDRTQAFRHKYLSTPPEAIVRHVIRGIRRGTPKIVYGHGSLKTWLGSNLLPLRWLNPIIWRDMAGVIDRRDYPPSPLTVLPSRDRHHPEPDQDQAA